MTKMEKLTSAYRVEQGKDFRLKDFDPADTAKMARGDATAHLEEGVAKLREMQNRLYAQDEWAVLLILQGMDASGKDGAIKHVMSGVNPLGCQAYSFKAPSTEELNHDYLWRTARVMPERGRIGIFNRARIVSRPHRQKSDRPADRRARQRPGPHLEPIQRAASWGCCFAAARI